MLVLVVELRVFLCSVLQDTLASGLAEALHFYTLNMEEPTYMVLRKLGVKLVEKADLNEEEMKKAYDKVATMMESVTLPVPPQKEAQVKAKQEATEATQPDKC